MIKNSLTFTNPHIEEEIRRLQNSLRYLSDKQKNVIIKAKVSNISPVIEDFEDAGEELLLPRGFFSKLIDMLRLLGFEYEIVDNLPVFEKISMSSNINLRDYQVDFVDKLVKRGGMGCATCGAGKTRAAIEVVSRLGLKTLWITHTSALAKQTFQVAKECLDTEIGYIGSGKWDVGNFTVALVQTLYRRNLEEISKDFGVVIVDESHNAPSKTFSETIKKFWARHIIGLTATPYRKDGLEPLMFNAIGPINARIEKDALIKKGFIVPAKVIQRKTGVKTNDSLSDYAKIMDIVNANNKRLNIIVGDVVAEASLGNTCVVLTSSIAYGKKIKNIINMLGLDAEIVFAIEAKMRKQKLIRIDSMTKKQREIHIERFKSGELKILIATFDFLSEGFDHAPLNRLFLASPISHKNYTLIEQSCGRVERCFPGKTDAIIYDYVDDGCSMLNYMASRRVLVYEENSMVVIS